MPKLFSRCVEDFVCGNCGKNVQGNGYTNHCPYCLFSKHVDVNPGDRAAKCGGLMEPIGVESVRKGYVLTFRCKKCGCEKKNKTAVEDNTDAIIELATKVAQGRR